MQSISVPNDLCLWHSLHAALPDPCERTCFRSAQHSFVHCWWSTVALPYSHGNVMGSDALALRSKRPDLCARLARMDGVDPLGLSPAPLAMDAG